VLAENVPASQAEHFVASVSAAYLPVSQLMQAAAPAEGWYLPAVHALQVDVSESAYWPAEHAKAS